MMRLLFGSRRHLPIGRIGAPLAERMTLSSFILQDSSDTQWQGKLIHLQPRYCFG